MEKIQWQRNPHKNLHPQTAAIANFREMERAMKFHRTLPDYAPTPLASLESLANYLGLGEIFVKDESYRFGLNSFKILGSSYAIANYLDEEYTKELNSFSTIKEKIKTLPSRVFATATAGNHGLGLAWTVKQFGQQSVVFMPKGSCLRKLDNLRALGAQAEITTLNYDDTVQYVSRLAQERNWILIQDTAWDGYVDTPKLIMQGYLTILGECLKQLKIIEKEQPTHVILQAGVGSFAGTIVEGLKQLVSTSIIFIVVEPTKADCFFQSGCSADGTVKNASGDLSTMMAGLACRDPNPIAWNILKNIVDCFVTCPDHVAAKGMRILGNPLDKDPRIISGESGAVPLGFLVEVCKNPLLKDLKKALELNTTSRILLISTEGDTDPENYRAICWDGKYPTFEE